MLKIGPSTNNYLILSRIDRRTIYKRESSPIELTIFDVAGVVSNLKPNTYYRIISDMTGAIEVVVGGTITGSKIYGFPQNADYLLINTRNESSISVNVAGITPTITMTEYPLDTKAIVDTGVHDGFFGVELPILQNSSLVIQGTTLLKTISDLSPRRVRIQVFPTIYELNNTEYSVVVNGTLETFSNINCDISVDHQGGDLEITVITQSGKIQVERILVTNETNDGCAITDPIIDHEIYLDGICNTPINIYAMCAIYDVHDKQNNTKLGEFWSNGKPEGGNQTPLACSRWDVVPGADEFISESNPFRPGMNFTSTIATASFNGFGTKIGDYTASTTAGNQVLKYKSRNYSVPVSPDCEELGCWREFFDGAMIDIGTEVYIKNPRYYLLMSKSPSLYTNHVEKPGFNSDTCGCNEARNLIINDSKIRINDIHSSPGSYTGDDTTVALMETARWYILVPSEEQCNESPNPPGTSEPESFNIFGNGGFGVQSTGIIANTRSCQASVNLVPISTSGVLSIYDLVFSNTTSGSATIQFMGGATLEIEHDEPQEQIKLRLSQLLSTDQCDVFRSGGLVRISITTTFARNPIILTESSVLCDSSSVTPPNGPFPVDKSRKDKLEVNKPINPVQCTSCVNDTQQMKSLTHDVIKYESITADRILDRYGLNGGVVYTTSGYGIDVVHPLDYLVRNSRYILSDGSETISEIERLHKTSTFIYPRR